MINRITWLMLMLLLVQGCQSESENVPEVPVSGQSVPPEATSDNVNQTESPSNAQLGEEQTSAGTTEVPEQSALAGTLPEEVEASTMQQIKEIAVEWVDRQRFWDQVRRTVASRRAQSVELTDEQQGKIIHIIEDVEEFFRHYDFLHRLCDHRVEQLQSDVVDQLVLAGLKGEFKLAKGTRKRRLALSSQGHGTLRWQEHEVRNVRQNLLDDNLSQGDLFYLAIVIRSAVLDYSSLREFELKVDEVCLSFPADLTLEAEALVACDSYNAKMLTASVIPREKWDRTAELAEIYSDANVEVLRANLNSDHSTSEIMKSIDDNDLSEYLRFAEEMEERGGGSEPLLKFPEVRMPPSRDKILAAFTHQFESVAAIKIDIVPELRQEIYDSMNEEQQKIVRSRGAYPDYRGPRQPDIAMLVKVDEAIRRGEDAEAVILSVKVEREKWRMLLEESRRKQKLEVVLGLADVGANHYFADVTQPN